MNPTRYILTRSCLQDGSMRLLKYNEPYFPESGPAQFVDDRGKAHEVQIDREAMRVTGLGGLYHDHNLNVNDVLLIRPTAPHRYEVEAVVKPYATPRSRPRSGQTRPGDRPEPRSVGNSGLLGSASLGAANLGATSVREVRVQGGTSGAGRRPRSGPSGGAGRNLSGLGEERRSEASAGAQDSARAQPIPPAFTPQLPRAQPELTPPGPRGAPTKADKRSAVSAAPEPTLPGAPDPAPTAPRPAPTQSQTTPAALAPAPAPAAPQPGSPGLPQPGLAQPGLAQSGLTELEEQLTEFARLTGYRLTPLGDGLVRLSAELGDTYRYSVLLAADPQAVSHPTWTGGEDDHRALISTESDRSRGTPRLTREALAALIEHARLVPLSALDLRGYWRAGNLDLESAASVAEWVGTQLAQRGTFTYVLLTLAAQPAQSVVNVSDLAERLGSAMSLDEMNRVLDTLARPPFSALTPLPGGQFLLRSAVPDLLADLADYAQGVRRRLRPAGE